MENSTTIEVVNGKWSINSKPLAFCSIAKIQLFSSFLRMKVLKSKIENPKSYSFKQRAKEVKEKYNYKFANFRHEKPIINIENKELIFERKK